MGRLWGNQQEFDKNDNGRLSAGEWQNWYLSTYGHDIEMAERKLIAQAESDWNAWLRNALQVICNTADVFMTAARGLLPSALQSSEKLAWQVFLCQVTVGLIEGNRWNVRQSTDAGVYVNDRVFYPYRALAYRLAESRGQCSRNDLEKAVLTRRPLFPEVGELTPARCGSFWQQIIAQLPPCKENTASESQESGAFLSSLADLPPETQAGLEAILGTLFPVASFFSGAGDEAGQRNARFQNYFTAHWRALRGVYDPPSFFPNLTVKQLTSEFPSLQRRSQEELSGADHSDLLVEMYYADPKRTVELWRSLFKTAAPLTDSTAAKDLFYQLEPIWLNSEFEPELLHPILDALQDDAFAKQMFQSAFVNYFHRNIIRAARACGDEELADHCLALLLHNPLPRRKWELDEEDLAELRSARKRGKAPQNQPAPNLEAVHPSVNHLSDDGTVFHYCTVQLQSTQRVYSYLAGALPLKVGDQVEVPFGKNDRPRRGQVTSIAECTWQTAPWPPEQSKKVLRILGAPLPSEHPVPTPQPVSAPDSEPKISLETVSEPAMGPAPRPRAPQESPASEGEKHPVDTGCKNELPAVEPAAVKKRKFPWKFF